MTASRGLNLVAIVLHLIIPCIALSNPQSHSILDLINKKEVERLLAEKQQNMSRSERRYLINNDLNENYIPPDQEYEIEKLKLLDGEAEIYGRTENPRVDIDILLKRNNISEPYRNTELLADLRGYNGKKLLKSSKNALLVTKKEYLQRDWCKTEPLIQKIKEEGCLTRTIINRFCYGQCNSFYIPKNPKRNRKRPVLVENDEEDQNGGPAFKSCSFCKPKKYTWITVTLKCPSMYPQYRKKRIQRIKQCKCIAANVN